MDAETLVLAVLDAMPEREIRGKKRLQKLSYFAKETSVDCNVRFFLHDFGPFSSEVAIATDLLTFLGDVSEEEIQFGRAKKFFKLYRLRDAASASEKLPQRALSALMTLNEYSTVELEIASTIRFFISKGRSVEDATAETRQLKPSKSQPKIIERAIDALLKVGLYERRREDQVSGSQSYQF